MSQFHNIPQSNGPPPTHIQGPPPPPQHVITNSFSNNQQQQHQQIHSATSTGLLKVSNLPSDLTRREAALIFSLVIDEMLSIEMKDFCIYAVFKNINTCITTGKLLDGKYIFGNDYPPIKVEYESNTLTSSPTTMSSTQAAFNSLRLSTSSASNISPPSITHQQLHHQNSNSSIGNGSSGPNPSNTFDMLPKRQSIGNPRSRFVFSDPFSHEQQQQQHQQQQQQQQQGPNQNQQQQQIPQPSMPHLQAQGPPMLHHRLSSGPPSTGPTPMDLSELSGKSILLMESQNDAREYENLVRDSWDPTHTSTGIPLLSSNPQTPGINSSIDWNNPSNGLNGSNQPTDRRRASSAFFNTAPALHTMTSEQANPQVSQQGPTAAGIRNALQHPEHQQQQQQQQPPQQQQLQQPPQQHQLPQEQQNILQPQQLQDQSQEKQTHPQSQLHNQPNNIHHVSPPSSSTVLQQQQPQPKSTSTSTPTQQSTTSPPSHRNSTTSKDIPDLSLLARVPPPANPADQNPPCNTLYVGNLPPDATEAELRTLFSPQKGFRRLSFRTKNQSSTNGSGSTSHNHGPMCFVEFEDVAHATRALAELYGSALPRPNGGNGKGGIRLSFSKNPLGVRGPGNPRRTSTNPLPNGSSQAQNQQQPAQQSQGGNYGYLNYHQK
ncbi:MAG: hypothetical protein M5E90_06850 [Asgard group archaeon]|nr:hypothetical protein [Asgard group archaeon]